MEKTFETTIKQSEQTNELLKKIESVLAQSRQELTVNLREIDAIAADTPKTN